MTNHITPQSPLPLTKPEQDILLRFLQQIDVYVERFQGTTILLSHCSFIFHDLAMYQTFNNILRKLRELERDPERAETRSTKTIQQYQ